MSGHYTSGGQVFLHRVRMFMQVVKQTCIFSIFFGIICSLLWNAPKLKGQDYPAIMSHLKASIVYGVDLSAYEISKKFGKSARRPHFSYVTIVGPSKDISITLRSNVAHSSQRVSLSARQFTSALQECAWSLIVFGIINAILIVVYWYKFGKKMGSDHQVEGNNRMLKGAEVAKILRQNKLASHLMIGDMPLVLGSQTRHILASGASGSGKTNLLHILLRQVEAADSPAIIVDHTGEMIARYYNQERGDVIFNPFDARTSKWDFWRDVLEEEALKQNHTQERLVKFAKILFSSGKRAGADPFWENSAAAVFNDLVVALGQKNDRSLQTLMRLINTATSLELEKLLHNMPSSRYFGKDAKGVIQSILSVLATGTQSLNLLAEMQAENIPSFTIKEHFQMLKQGQKKWLFLAGKPSSRQLTLPLLGALLEFAASELMDIGISKQRNIWFCIDELASFGQLHAMTIMMQEGRKYGACVVAAMQSLNQLYHNYGQAQGEVIFGQFGTKFFFRNDEPQIARIISQMFGQMAVKKQQKNTSFGAHQFRDGVSYTEHEKQQNLVEYSDISSLGIGEAYVILPEPKVRLAKITVPESLGADKVEAFARRTNLAQQDETQEPSGMQEESNENENNNPKAEQMQEAESCANASANQQSLINLAQDISDKIMKKSLTEDERLGLEEKEQNFNV